MTYSEARKAGLAFYVQADAWGFYCPTPCDGPQNWRFGDNGQFAAYSDAVRTCAVLNDKARAMA